jgi:putative spermidine/putrescine transport system permease protein
VFSPALVSVIVRAYGWQLLLSNNGVVNYALSGLSLTDGPVRLVFNWLGVIISMIHIQLPFMLFPILTVLMQLPRGLVEAAQDLGANQWQVLRRVVFPLSLPGVLAGCQIVFTTGISAFASPTILGGGRVRVMPVTIYQNILSLNWPMGAVQSILLLGFSLVLVVVFTRLLRVGNAWTGEVR